MLNWMRWFPEDVSTYGGDVDSVFALIYWVGLVWFVITLGTFGLFLVIYRRRQGRRAFYITGEPLRQAAWILVPCAVILALDLWIDWQGAPAWAKVKGQFPPAELTIQVTDRQFNNEIHVPVGRPVRLTLKAGDVVHSFFAPNLRFKQDMVPGRLTAGWF